MDGDMYDPYTPSGKFIGTISDNNGRYPIQPLVLQDVDVKKLSIIDRVKQAIKIIYSGDCGIRTCK